MRGRAQESGKERAGGLGARRIMPLYVERGVADDTSTIHTGAASNNNTGGFNSHFLHSSSLICQIASFVTSLTH